MKRRLTAGVLAAATALSLSVAPAANAQTWDEMMAGLNAVEALAYLGAEGTGTMPKTGPALEMLGGSVEAGSSGKQAYYATQVGWGLLWTALAATGVGALALAAQQLGLVKLPF